MSLLILFAGGSGGAAPVNPNPRRWWAKWMAHVPYFGGASRIVRI